MTEPNWKDIITGKAVVAPQKELWVRLVDLIRGPRKLRIQAAGQWNYDPQSSSGPDGDPAEGFEDGNLHKSALRGCLLAKIGGSGGDAPEQIRIQAVGSYCLFEIPAEVCGPLFVTMNDNPKRFHLHSGELTVTVSEAPGGN